MTYTDRREETIVIKEARLHDDGKSIGILTTNSSGFDLKVIPGIERIVVGDSMILESRGFSIITGLKFPDEEWIFHKTDEELAADRQRMIDGFHATNQRRLEAHRAEWATREAALPDDLRERLEFFRGNSVNFDRDGWGYELIVCELALMYAASENEDTPEISAYAEKHMTSGNQHGAASTLASLSLMGELRIPAREVPAALAPLMRSTDYSGD